MVPTRLVLDWFTVDSATLESWLTEASNWLNWLFSLARTATAGPMVSIPLAMAESPLAIWPLSVARLASAVSTAALFELSDVTMAETPSRMERICDWWPLNAALACVTIVSSWLRPPPLSRAPRAASVSAMDGAESVSVSGRVAPALR